jgi:ABC-type branched-subunit amino acid transport system ATPase component
VSDGVSPRSASPAVPLETSELSRSYGRLVALQGLSLAVAVGDCVALIGANGSGKTTAVRAIAGLLEPGGGIDRPVLVALIRKQLAHVQRDGSEAKLRVGPANGGRRRVLEQLKVDPHLC